MSKPEPTPSASNIANLILALLAPMFLWSTAGDIRLAYAAAAETVNEYRAANRLSLMTVAKIIAFDIATLSSLSQSMHEDTPVVLALRLRGNANSLDRSGERNRRALEAASHSAPARAAEEPVESQIAHAQQMILDAKTRINAARSSAPEPAAHTAPPAAEAATDAAARTQTEQPAWPGAMTAVAEAFAAGLEDVPPGQQWTEMARIMALTAEAADIATAAAPPPASAMAAE
jgi:hypothetical protein